MVASLWEYMSVVLCWLSVKVNGEGGEGRDDDWIIVDFTGWS